ncbi:MAG TPA: pilus assembly protein TadG-related protein [Candidatus Angelobacter sp.]|nr:pilus assembly protein TadG-related protein [Candidatus Angelobacter sp.]
MRIHQCHHSRRDSSQLGQTFIPIVIFIGVFLLAMLGVAADYSQVWAHRQMAQGAADAACEAASADLYLNSTDPSASGQNGLQSFSWISSSAFDCTTNTNSPPCRYASLNGYSGSSVHVSFPGSLPGVAPLPPAFATAQPYIEVTITDAVPMSFTKLVSTTSVVNVKAKAGCGLVPIVTPVPLVILHPTASSALSVGGASLIHVFGGPQRSVQVDSRAANAVAVGTVDLSQGGPANTGSDFAVFGGPSTQPAGINTGSTGHYIYPATPFGDPFATIGEPTVPSTLGTATPVPFGMNGCPDPNGCVEFTPGSYVGCVGGGNIAPGAHGCLMIPYTGSNPKFSAAAAAWVSGQHYTAGAMVQPALHNAGNFIYQATNTGNAGAGPNPWNQTVCLWQADGTCSGGTQPDGSILWRNVGVITLNKLNTGIFDPGLYYVAANGLNLGSGSTARLSTAVGDGSDGVTFYFSTSASVSVTSNSGNSAACVTASSGAGSPNGCVVSFKIDGTVSSAATGTVGSRRLQCPSGSANPPQVPAVLNGNILLGPCSGTYASPDHNRGFLFFQNRAAAAAPSWGGGGQFLSSGFLYFHSGVGTTCGSNTSCLTLQGGSGAQSYTLGNIVVDELALGGNPQINMILNPTASFQIVRPTLLE